MLRGDNREHLLDACARLADVLLRGCLEVKILPTSRETLGLTGEVAFHVPRRCRCPTRLTCHRSIA